MPKVEFGQKTHFDGGKSDFLELKNKDQKFHIRFIGSAVYDGKHFLQTDDGKWEVPYCKRIMENEPCPYCEKFFEAKKMMKALKAEKGEVDVMDMKDKMEYKRLEKVAKRYGETTTFYYPVINRETETAGILKCAPSIRGFLEEEFSNDIKILDFDYIIKRTEIPGKYYTLTRLDSSAIKPLTPKELDEIEKGLAWDLEKIVNSKPSSMSLEAPESSLEGLDLGDEISDIEDPENGNR